MRPGAARAIHPTRLEPYPLGRDNLRRRIAYVEHLLRCERVMAHDRRKEPILRIPFGRCLIGVDVLLSMSVSAAQHLHRDRVAS